MDFSSRTKAVECLQKRLLKEADVTSEVLLKATQDLKEVDLGAADAGNINGAIAVLLRSDRWDAICVGLLAACDYLPVLEAVPEDLKASLVTAIGLHLEHKEPRVRSLVAKTLGALCKAPGGAQVYDAFHGQLWSSVECRLSGREVDTMATNYAGSEEIALDDVTGWKCLETSLLALVAIADACMPELERAGRFEEALWVDVAVEAAVRHRNRYVREAGMGMARALVDGCTRSLGLRERLAGLIAEGLADPWPQVVFAASGAARSLLLSVSKEEEGDVLGVVLPRLCMNRYYVPEGVQVHSQETWERLFGTAGGRAVVAAHVEAVVREYVTAMGDQRSHFSRVAACYAVRELAAKVEAGVVQPHEPALMHAVMHCLKDNHWEVRSAACVAVGQLVTSFPEEASCVVDELLALCMSCLEHESWSIREDAACALGDMGRCIKGRQVVERLVQRLRSTIMTARQQPSQSRAEAAKQVNDVAAHTGRAVFGCCGNLDSCGGKARPTRPAQPWEVSDGALYLLRELCQEDVRPDSLAAEFMPLLADVIRLDHFPQADRLRQTAWSVLPEIASRLGKRMMKQYLDLFTPALLSSLSSPLASQLTRHAAIGCLESLSRIIGPAIFIGRLPEPERDLFLRLSADHHGPAAPNSSSATTALFPELRLRPSLVSI